MRILLDEIPVAFDVEKLADQAHVDLDDDDGDDFRDLVVKAAAVARPKALVQETFIDAKGEETVALGGVTFTSRALRRNLDEAERVFAYVATCGAELDAVPLPAGDVLHEFWLDTIKASGLATAIGFLGKYVKTTWRLKGMASMNPGSGEATVWPIEQQRELFRLLGDVHGDAGVTLTESYLMLPNKSVSGLYYPTEKDFKSCQVCRREVCDSRRAPFDEALWTDIHGEG